MSEENTFTTIADGKICEMTGITIADIQARIFTIRGVQVMLDRDLAMAYEVQTKALNQAVKRNARRFPERFMFQLSNEEFEKWKSQIVTSNIYTLSEVEALKMGARRRPYAFTEQGVAQLSSVLHSDVADDVSVKIMDAFVAMRRFISANANLFQRVEAVEIHQIESDKKIELVLNKLDELSPAPTTEQMFTTGCVWDAYTFVCDLVRSAKKRIVLIDNFVDERTLLILDKRQEGVDAEVHTRFTEQVKLDFGKHNEQCEEIRYVQLPLHVHDRYMIIDDEVWLLGASVKDMGHGLCSIVKMGLQPDALMALLS